MKTVRLLAIAAVLVGIAHLGIPLVSSANEQVDSVKSQPVERYVMEKEIHNADIPVIADGKHSIQIRVRLLDGEKKQYLPLTFATKGTSKETTGSVQAEKLAESYLLTYTPPDISKLDIKQTSDNILVSYRDDQNVPRYKKLELPLQNPLRVSVTKPGFDQQEQPVTFDGKLVRIKVFTILPSGETIPLNGAEVRLDPKQEPLFTNEAGLIDVASPSTPNDNKINEYRVVLAMDQSTTAAQKEALRYYNAASKGEFGITNVTVEEHLQNFQAHLAATKNTLEANKMLSGIHRLASITFLLNRSSNTVGRASRNIGKAARNQLWETIDLYEDFSQLTRNIKRLLAAATPQEQSKQIASAVELDALLDTYPLNFIEIACSITGIAIALNAPDLDEDTVNGFFQKVIDIIAAKNTSGREWGAIWFEKEIADDFREQNLQSSLATYRILADMIKKNSFEEKYNHEELTALTKNFQATTDQLLSETRVQDIPLFGVNDLKKNFSKSEVPGTGAAFYSLVTASNFTYEDIKQKYFENDDLPKWLAIYEMVSHATASATKEAAGIAPKNASMLTPFVIPLVFAEQANIKPGVKKGMQTIAQYRLSLIDNVYFKLLRNLGEQLLVFGQDQDVISQKITEIVAKEQFSAEQTVALEKRIPAKFRESSSKIRLLNNNIPLSRIIVFALLLAFGLIYLMASLLKKDPPESVEDKNDDSPPPADFPAEQLPSSTEPTNTTTS